MVQPSVKVLGAYKVEISDEAINEFLKENYDKRLTEDEMKRNFIVKRQELKSVAALDVSVMNADERFDIGDFTQPDSDQVAYDEVYLSMDGYSIESEIRPQDPKNFRIYFFLHSFDPKMPLLSSYGKVDIPKIGPLPKHLNSLHPFKPVD